MKSTLNIFGILFIAAIISSCSSSRPIVDDNVYMLKTAAIPIGENLLDETSYATYKYREDSKNPTTGYYNPNNPTVRNTNRSVFISPSFYSYGMMYGVSSSYGYMPYNPYMYSHYGFGNTPYFANYNPYGYPYGGYYGNNFYGNNFYGNNYYGGYYGMNSPYYYSTPNYQVNSTNSGNFYSSGNHVSGPRATQSGYYSGVSRGGTQQLKSQVQVPQSTSSTGNVPSYQNVSRSAPVRNRPVTERIEYTSNQRVLSNPNSNAVRYNNQQSRSTQSRGNVVRNNPTYVGSESRSTRSTNSTTVRPSSRGNSTFSSPTQRSSGGNVSVPSSRNSTPAPSQRSSSPSTSGGGRRQ